MKFEIIKKSILLSLLIILLGIYYGMDNPIVDRKYELKKDSSLAIWVYDDNSKDYVTSDSVPIGKYELNQEKSYCENGSKINSYDSALGKLNYILNTNDKCYVYFDEDIPYLSKVVMALADGQARKSSHCDDCGEYIVEHETFTSSDTGKYYDVGYYYQGYHPDFFVDINGTQGNIMGVFDGKNMGLEPGKMYAKILLYDTWKYFKTTEINPDSLFENVCHPAMVGINELQNSYLNDLDNDVKKFVAQYNGNFSSWSLRSATTSYNLTVAQWLELERETGTVLLNCTNEIISPIGMFYPSDIGYATYSDNNDEQVISMHAALNNNWIETYASIIGMHQFLLMTSYNSYPTLYYTNASNYYLYPISSVNEVDAMGMGMTLQVPYVLYLEHDVIVSSGDGSEENPYILTK